MQGILTRSVATMFATMVASVLAVTDAAMADVTFASDDDIMIVRILEDFGFVTVEVIASHIDSLTCVLMDANGEPVALAQGFVENGAGEAIAVDVAPNTVTSASCNGSSY